MSSASIRRGGRFLRRDPGYGDALKQIKLNEGFALRHAHTLEDFPMHHFLDTLRADALHHLQRPRHHHLR
jgi:hypothetical protein